MATQECGALNSRRRSGRISRILFARARLAPRATGRSFIWTGRCRPARAPYPQPVLRFPRVGNSQAWTGRPPLLIWACWRWGLPCHDRHRPRGALLPHHFTLTGRVRTRRRRYLFCGTFPRLTPGWRYQPPCPAQFGLSSRRSADARKHPPAGARSPPPASPPPAIIPDCDPAYEPAHGRRMRVRATM
jgi:hypothetical protein